MKREIVSPIKEYEDLTFSDNFMFCEIMKNNPDLCNIELGDGTAKIFINTRGALDDASPKMKEFIQYLSDGAANGSLTKRIDEKLVRALRDEGGRLKYMTFEWALARERRIGKEEGLAEGKAEGLAEGKAEVIVQLLKSATPAQLAVFGISEEDIEAAKNLVAAER